MKNVKGTVTNRVSVRRLSVEVAPVWRLLIYEIGQPERKWPGQKTQIDTRLDLSNQLLMGEINNKA